MGLLDILNGMQNGPRGEKEPGQGGMSPITMAILALLAYKAYQKVGPGQSAPAPAPGGSQPRLPDATTTASNEQGGGGLGDILGGLLGGGSKPSAGGTAASGGLGDILGGLLGGGKPPATRAAGDYGQSGGGLDDLLKGGLGGLLAGGAAGGAAGSVLNGGLGDLLKQFQDAGQGDVANSWVGKGPNRDISEEGLARSIGLDDIDALARNSGMSRQQLLSGLSRELPGVIDQLTPDGRLPTDDEAASRW